MNYESALRSIESDGFRWGRIQDYFPFGDEALREGNYQRLALRWASRFANKEPA